MEDIKDLITQEIISMCHDKEYRTPLVGFSSTNHPMYDELKNIIHKNHLHPNDILENGQTVVSFFLPFKKELVDENQSEPEVTISWGECKKDTDILINNIIESVKQKLNKINIESSLNAGIGAFNKEKFTHPWSQRHAAYICGLGTFGINNMLITDSGCAGRYGSFIISEKVEYNNIINTENCLYKLSGKCGICMKRCPVNALHPHTTDKQKCSDRLDYMTQKYFDDDSRYNSCGKCICEPCATKNPSK